MQLSRHVTTGSLFALIASLAITGAAHAGSALLDLEDQDVGDGTTSLSLTDGFLSAEVSRAGGASFDVVDLSVASGTVAFGSRSLRVDGGAEPLVINLNSTRAVNSFSATMGDFGGDEDTLTMRAYTGADGGGTLVDTAELTLPGTDEGDETFSFFTLLVQGDGIRSVEVFGGSGGTQSAFVDNLGATAIPLPGAALAFPLTALVAGFAMRRFRRRRS